MQQHQTLQQNNKHFCVVFTITIGKERGRKEEINKKKTFDIHLKFIFFNFSKRVTLKMSLALNDLEFHYIYIYIGWLFD